MPIGLVCSCQHYGGAGRDTFPIIGKDMPEGAASWQDLTVTVLGVLSVLILVSAVLIVLAARNKDTK
jgi:hypothetical protein